LLFTEPQRETDLGSLLRPFPRLVKAHSGDVISLIKFADNHDDLVTAGTMRSGEQPRTPPVLLLLSHASYSCILDVNDIASFSSQSKIRASDNKRLCHRRHQWSQSLHSPWIFDFIGDILVV